MQEQRRVVFAEPWVSRTCSGPSSLSGGQPGKGQAESAAFLGALYRVKRRQASAAAAKARHEAQVCDKNTPFVSSFALALPQAAWLEVCPPSLPRLL